MYVRYVYTVIQLFPFWLHSCFTYLYFYYDVYLHQRCSFVCVCVWGGGGGARLHITLNAMGINRRRGNV
ncbi:hypothetical protein Hanom_Chr14g01301531 [Helianthus anomalus]